MGRKKHIFDSDELEQKEEKSPNELVEIDLESGTDAEPPFPEEETFSQKKLPQPLKPWAVMLIFLGLAVLSSLISAVLWYSGQVG